MSSLVLARKYRPRSFGEMVGQEHVVRALVNALASGRLHHAYLFTGTRGVGKTTVSRILAKSLNCTGPDDAGGITPEPCGVCRACTEIDADRFIDYVEMDAASNRGIDEIRDLLERAAYKPAVGRFKVFMIDEVHQLTGPAFNALLKTLEEPPEYLKFVLATTDPEKILPTVLSRCLQFNLRPMAPQTVRERLVAVLTAEGVAAEPGALALLSRAARGSMRDALSLTDQAIAFGGGGIEEAGVRQMLGTVGRDHVLALIEAVAAGDGRALVAAVDALRDEGLAAEGALEEMAALLQTMAVQQAVPGTLDSDDADAPALARLAAALPPDEMQVLYSIALHGRAELPLAPDEYSGLVMVLLRMLAFRPAGAVRPAPQRTEAPAGDAQAPTARNAGAAMAAVPLTRPSAASTSVAPNGRASAGVPSAASNGAGTAPATARPSVPPWEDDVPPEDDASARRARADAPTGASTEAPTRASADAPTPASADAPTPARAEGARAASRAPSGDEPTSAPDHDVSRTAAAVPLPDNPRGERWAGLVAQLIASNAVAAMVRELALQSECVALDDGQSRIVLRVEREALHKNPVHAERLQAALAALLGHAVTLAVEPGAVVDTPARREAAAREARQRQAEAALYNDPQVQGLLTQFKTARVVPGSIKPV